MILGAILLVISYLLLWYSINMISTGYVYQAGNQVEAGRFRIILGSVVFFVSGVIMFFAIAGIS